jgi:hypothetical protein
LAGRSLWTLNFSAPPDDMRSVSAAELPWRPLGSLLVQKGLVSENELDDALAEQERSGRRLGEIMLEAGMISGPALTKVLAEQWGVDLASEIGFGSGLRDQIERRHEEGRQVATRNSFWRRKSSDEQPVAVETVVLHPPETETVAPVEPAETHVSEAEHVSWLRTPTHEHEHGSPDVESVVEESGNASAELELRLSELRERTAEVEAAEAALEERAQAVAARKASLEEEAAQLEATEAEVERAWSRLSEVGGQVEAKRQEIGEAKSAFEGAQRELGELKAALANQQDELGRANGEVEAAKAQVGRLEGERQSAGARLAQAQLELGELQRMLDAVREERSAVQDELSRAHEEPMREAPAPAPPQEPGPDFVQAVVEALERRLADRPAPVEAPPVPAPQYQPPAAAPTYHVPEEARPEVRWGHLLFLRRGSRYELIECPGPAPPVGTEVVLPGGNARSFVTRVGPSPLPHDPRLCVYLDD